MIKSTRGANPVKYALGKALEKVGEGGEFVGENSGWNFAEAISFSKEENLHSPNPPE